MFRNQSLKAKFAGMPKQVRADLALLKGVDKNPVDPSRQQPGKVVLSKVQRKLPQIVAVKREPVESVKLHLGVVPIRTIPECRPVYPIALS
jgi:hypothetical protein